MKAGLPSEGVQYRFSGYFSFVNRTRHGSNLILLRYCLPSSNIPLTRHVYRTSRTRALLTALSDSALSSPRSRMRQTGKVTQTCMFRTNKKALVFLRFEQNDFKILILSFKNLPTHILISKKKIKNMHVCITFQK